MCKISILIGACFIFCGCSGNEPKPSHASASLDESSSTKIKRKTSITDKYPGCKLLASGYLVCPKARR